MKNEENKNKTEKAKRIFIKIITSVAIFIVVSGFMLTLSEEGTEIAKGISGVIIFFGLCLMGIGLANEKWGKK